MQSQNISQNQCYLLAYAGTQLIDSILNIINYYFGEIDESQYRKGNLEDLKQKQLFLLYISIGITVLQITIQLFLIKCIDSTTTIYKQLSIRYSFFAISYLFLQIIIFIEFLNQLESNYYTLIFSLKIGMALVIFKNVPRVNNILYSVFVLALLIFSSLRVFDLNNALIIPRIQLVFLIVSFLLILNFGQLKEKQTSQSQLYQQPQNQETFNFPNNSKQEEATKLEEAPLQCQKSQQLKQWSTTQGKIEQTKEEKPYMPLQKQQSQYITTLHHLNDNNSQSQQFVINLKKASEVQLGNMMNNDDNQFREKPQKQGNAGTFTDGQMGKKKKFQFILSLFNELPDGLLLLNSKLICLHMNKKCKKLLKVEDENLAATLILHLQNISKSQSYFQSKSSFTSLYQSKNSINEDSSKPGPSRKQQYTQLYQSTLQPLFKSAEIDDRNNNQLSQNSIIQKQSAKNVKSDQLFSSKPFISKIIDIKKVAVSTAKSVIDEVSQILDNLKKNRTSDVFVNQIFVEHKMQMICQLGINAKQQSKILQIIFMPCSFNNEFCVYCIIKNLTYLQRIDLLEQLNENKSMMLSQVAHEIRTPLNCIINMLDISQQCKSIDQIQGFIQPSLTSAKLLSNLIHDLLDIAQQKAGTFQLTITKFHLKGLLFEIKDLMSLQALSQGIELIIDYGKSVQDMITSDQYRLRQIIINLLGNALKYTKKGSVQIIINNYNNNSHILEIKIKDTGIGIKEENLAKLFQAFSKVETDKDKHLNPQGVGLGLMISNMLVKSLEPASMNRGLKVQSELGKGTEFSFLLLDHSHDIIIEVFKEEDNQQQYLNNQSSFLSEHNKTFLEINVKQINTKLKDFTIMRNQDNFLNNYITINEHGEQIDNGTANKNERRICKCSPVLIVDDQQFNILTLQQILKFFGIQSDSAQSGEECEVKCNERLKNACCKQYQLILIDFDMEGQDGIQTTKNLVKFFNQNNISTSIIGCTGYTDQNQMALGKKAGMLDIISKPIDRMQLKALLDKYIN